MKQETKEALIALKHAALRETLILAEKDGKEDEEVEAMRWLVEHGVECPHIFPQKSCLEVARDSEDGISIECALCIMWGRRYIKLDILEGEAE